ncbi:unnamed protein product [Calypogeia fissa]
MECFIIFARENLSFCRHTDLRRIILACGRFSSTYSAGRVTPVICCVPQQNEFKPSRSVHRPVCEQIHP